MGRLCDAASRLAVLCALGLLAFAAPVHAQAPNARAFGLTLSPHYLQQSQVGALTAFVAEVERLIPPRVKAAIGGRIAVSFTLA